MGGCVSLSPEEQEQKRASEAIDRRIRVELKDFENTIKILLLGWFLAVSFVRSHKGHIIPSPKS